MSRIGKISLLIAGFLIICAGIFRLFLGAWTEVVLATAAGALLFFIVSAVTDRRLYAEFFTLRTTKHGLNMGAIILIAIVFLVTFNFLAVRFNKTVDVTSEKLNSLSEESIKLAQGLKSDLQVTLLYDQAQNPEGIKRLVSQLVSLYRNHSPHIRYEAYNARQRPDLIAKYEYRYGNLLLVEYDGKQQKVDSPEALSEESFSKALLRVSRDANRVIYFTAGHGERELNDKSPQGLSGFAVQGQQLEGLKDKLEGAYQVKSLKLFEEKQVPADAAAVAIVGPTQQFTEVELDALRTYARSGGSLLIAVDPMEKHNLALLTKTFGIEFRNDMVIDPNPQFPQFGPAALLVTDFSRSSPITSGLRNENVVVLQASSLRKAPDANPEFSFEELLKTGPRTMGVLDIRQQPLRADSKGPHVLGLAVKGKLPEADKEFNVVVFGDSDFLASQLFTQNKSIVMNAFSFLVKDSEMISIRPKSPKGTSLVMTRNDFLGFFLLVCLPIPVILFLSGGVIWFRRRTA